MCTGIEYILVLRSRFNIMSGRAEYKLHDWIYLVREDGLLILQCEVVREKPSVCKIIRRMLVTEDYAGYSCLWGTLRDDKSQKLFYVYDRYVAHQNKKLNIPEEDFKVYKRWSSLWSYCRKQTLK